MQSTVSGSLQTLTRDPEWVREWGGGNGVYRVPIEGGASSQGRSSADFVLWEPHLPPSPCPLPVLRSPL